MKINAVLYDHCMGSEWRIPYTETQNMIMLLVADGKITYTIEGETLHMTKGDALFIPMGTMRSAEADFNAPHEMYSVHFQLPEPKGIDLTLLLERSYRKIKTRSFEYLKQRFSLLYELWMGRTPYYEMIVQGMTLEMLGLFHRELATQVFPTNKLYLVQQVQEYIIRNYRDPIRIGDLAEHINRTPNYVSNMFKEVTSRTPIEYLHHVRIAAARGLLQTTAMTMKEISDYLGFCDQTYFNHVYKKIIGTPPSAMLRGDHRA